MKRVNKSWSDINQCLLTILNRMYSIGLYIFSWSNTHNILKYVEIDNITQIKYVEIDNIIQIKHMEKDNII